LDINGAKALKERLGQDGAADDDPRVSADVSEDAPPVFRWLGVSNTPPGPSAADGPDEETAPRASLFRRLGLSFR
jgi:hypothetical protein